MTTLLLGADWSAQRWQADAALSHSWGSGSYEGDNNADGEISSTVTGVFPYGCHALTPRLGLWATAGYGWGDLSLKPDGMEEEYKPATTMTMAALGIDGLLLDGGSEGISLNTTADLVSPRPHQKRWMGWSLPRATSPASAWGWRPSGPSPWPMALPPHPLHGARHPTR